MPRFCFEHWPACIRVSAMVHLEGDTSSCTECAKVVSQRFFSGGGVAQHVDFP